jgi:hypothetical protein
MSFCRIGLHRWSFVSRLIDEPVSRTHTEFVYGRCRRAGCRRHGTWALMNVEVYAVSEGTNAAPAPTAAWGQRAEVHLPESSEAVFSA